jgi:hypothetical protein
MLGNEAMGFNEILKTHRNETIKRMLGNGGKILLVQDTMSVDYNNHKKTEGIGYISKITMGVNIHSCLGVSSNGLVLGVLDQSNFNRSQAENNTMTDWQKKLRKIDEKESNRWLETLENTAREIPQNIDTLTVCDREGDFYELLSKANELKQSILVRIVNNRNTVDNKHIMDEIRSKRTNECVSVTIPRDSRNSVPERKAVLELRYARFEVKKPNLLNRETIIPKTTNLNVIYVKEKKPPKGSKPIEWFLSTNDTIKTWEDAYKYVGYYIQRWKIERFHYVLKSGCKIESLQERSIAKTVMLILMYSIIAVPIMNITYAGRVSPDAPCSILLDSNEWKLLYCIEFETTKSPKKPYSMETAIKYLGNLGGPRRAPSGGPPGLKTIWLGLVKLYTLLSFKELLACDFVGQV